MKYDEEHIAIIIKALRQKKGRVAACKEAGISYETFMSWMENKLEFSETIKRAEKQGDLYGEEQAIAAILKAMDKNWQSAAWWLERNFPERYKQRNDVTSGDEPISEVVFKVVHTKKDETGN